MRDQPDFQFPGTGLWDPPPEKGDPELNLARKAQRAGYSRSRYVTERGKAIRLTAKVLRWDSTQIDQAYTALALIAEEVWGEHA